jgi:hypothetical protein
MGAIVAELLTIRQGSYVVRALVQLGGTSFASGMATAANIEMAEDRAKIRALLAFGIAADSPPQSASSLYPSHEPFIQGQSERASTSLDSLPQDLLPQDLLPQDLLPQDLLPQLPSLPKVAEFKSEIEVNLTETPIAPDSALSSSANSTQNLALPVAETVSLNTESSSFTYANSTYADSTYADSTYAESTELNSIKIDLPEIKLNSEFDSTISEPLQPWVTPPDQNNKPESSAPTKAEKSTKRKAEPKPSTTVTPESAESGDRSNEIARIGVEMKRLSWTTEQGRGYLKRTYGKRSRQELDDIELLDFLRFLEAQPSPSQTLF